MALLTSNAEVKASQGIGATTYVVTLSKTSITQDEMDAAIKTMENEGNVVVGTILATNVLTCAVQGAGITAGADYGTGSTGVTSAVVYTFA